ncbi:hypothetical protein E2I00_000289 [Balaenoptera physalus]|uniref:Potassium channel tetramerisation-type BTB domain-containing protein n=1 Tax=Balaenoptera physalus TaxID=9770 RepID=A0A6A1Q9Y4_BALPH|nr:hypothetical protein E2I00_000289 [Balaenoptera physalus]
MERTQEPGPAGNRMALCKDSHQELKDPARRAENCLLRRGPGGFLDTGGPKPNQIPSARLLFSIEGLSLGFMEKGFQCKTLQCDCMNSSVLRLFMEEMSGESVVSSAVPVAATRTTSFKGTSPSSKYVKLNVGGVLYDTTMQTLTKQDTMLKAVFSRRIEVLTDSEGWILIDRCGKLYGTILNYLCDGAVLLPESCREIEELQAEAKYHLVQGPGGRVPAVKLPYNRSNNKYLYTSNSDNGMLKNIELFDKLSLSFNGRVLFIKDVIGDEICCWSFYSQGRKIAEVCCTSIVYATEKKQTKVEFPEARIYEETLNILLSEAQDGRGPDSALLEATGGVAGCSHHLDEDKGKERERIYIAQIC